MTETFFRLIVSDFCFVFFWSFREKFLTSCCCCYFSLLVSSICLIILSFSSQLQWTHTHITLYECVWLTRCHLKVIFYQLLYRCWSQNTLTCFSWWWRKFSHFSNFNTPCFWFDGKQQKKSTAKQIIRFDFFWNILWMPLKPKVFIFIRLIVVVAAAWISICAITSFTAQACMHRYKESYVLGCVCIINDREIETIFYKNAP